MVHAVSNTSVSTKYGKNNTNHLKNTMCVFIHFRFNHMYLNSTSKSMNKYLNINSKNAVSIFAYAYTHIQTQQVIVWINTSLNTSVTCHAKSPRLTNKYRISSTESPGWGMACHPGAYYKSAGTSPQQWIHRDLRSVVQDVSCFFEQNLRFFKLLQYPFGDYRSLKNLIFQYIEIVINHTKPL